MAWCHDDEDSPLESGALVRTAIEASWRIVISLWGQWYFVYFRVSLRVHGSAYRLIFTKFFQSLAGQFCDQEIDEFSYYAFIYRPHLQSHLTG